MKKITFILSSFFLLFCSSAFAQQTPIPDGSFEGDGWKNKQGEYGPYLDFETSLFYTLNSLYELKNTAGPADRTAWRENRPDHANTTQNPDATIQHGAYCIRLTSGRVAGGTDWVFLPGMVGTISKEFVKEFLNPGQYPDGVKISRPWENDTPHALEGYYKYKPVNGDSALITIGFYDYKGEVNLGIVPLIIKETVTDKWQKFSIDIPKEHWNKEFLEIKLLFVASAGVKWEKLDECVGELGSTLWVDNVSLNYTKDPNGIKQNLFSTLKANAFPNPANEVLNIELNENFTGKVVIYNISGSMIMEENINGTQHQLNTSALATGNYIYRLMNDNTIFAQGKFVVTK